jgi:hypothetical protein
MRFIYFHIFLLFLLFSDGIQAQKPLNNNTDYRQGLYTHINQFQQNKPGSLLSQLRNFDYELNTEENVLILSLETQKQLDSLFGKDVWGICVDGIPYVLTADSQKGRPYFVKLHVIGKLCYFYYKAFRDKEVTMYVHNPFTGEKIGQKNITNKELVAVQRILHFDTGETTDFNLSNMQAWTKDDAGLNKSLMEMKKSEVEEKLFKTLLIYNDRNPVYSK